MSKDKFTIVEHLEELRSRIISILIFLVIVSAISYALSDQVLLYLKSIVGRLIFLKPYEAFVIKLKISLFLGLFFSIPYILYHIWRFIQPGLIGREKKILKPLFLGSYILFILGALFSTFVILPKTTKLLLEFGKNLLEPLISVASFLNFVILFTLILGIFFQIPIIMLALVYLEIVSLDTLIKKRSFIILGIFILSAILTPTTDVISMLFVAIPGVLLYELSIILCKIIFFRRLKK